MKKILFYIIVLSIPFFLQAQDNGDTLNAANEAFKAANSSTDINKKQQLYKQALLNYERLLKDYKNGPLYYNIANTYFMLGDMGHAILNYRKALRFSPQDENIATNLEFARKKRLDQIEKTHSAIKTLFLANIASSSKYKLAAFSTAFFWLLCTAYLIKKKSVYLKAGCIFLIITIIFCSSAIINDSQREAVITASDVVARKGDGLSYEPSFNEPLHAGTELAIIEERAEWLHVILENGKDAWLPSTSVEEI